MTFRALGMRAAVTSVLLLCGTTVSGQTLKNVEVRGVGDQTRIILKVDGAVTHKSFRLEEPDRIVVDLVGAANATAVGPKRIPAGSVARVRVAQFASEPQAVTRVVADLREPADFRVISEGQLVVVMVTPKNSRVNQQPQVVAKSVDEAVDIKERPVQTTSNKAASQLFPLPVLPVAQKTAEDGAAENTDVKAVQTAVPVVPSTATQAAPSTPTAKADVPAQSGSQVVHSQVAAGENVTQSAPVAHAVRPPIRKVAEKPSEARPHVTSWQSGTVKPLEDRAPKLQETTLSESHGRRINLDVQGADIRTVLRTLSDYSGRNIIASREVQGEVTATLKDAPWESALEAILKAHGYGYVEEQGIIRVGVMQKIRNEELEEAAAERKREDLLPIETRVVRLEFADAEEMRTSLNEMLTQRGRMQVDARTNALIVSDIPQNVAMLAEMAAELDSRTPQVEIVSKLVDVSADDSRNLGIQWGAADLEVGDFYGSAEVNAATPTAVGNIRVGTVQSWGQLDLMLDALARSKRANIVSNPNITTVNNREAKILVGAKIPLIVADEAGNAITQLTTIGIQMRVTPHVNSDKTITLDLHPEVSDLSAQATVQGGVIINTSEADTRVIVNNNETAIIGGLIRDVTSEVTTGIPVLKDIPGLGWLFSNSNKTQDKRELIIFVTPRLIEAEASLSPQDR